MDDNGRFLHRGMRRQDRLDLTDFNAVAKQFDLLIEPAEKLQTAIGQPTTTIARAIQPCPGLGAERIGYKALGRQLRIVKVAARQTRAADV